MTAKATTPATVETPAAEDPMTRELAATAAMKAHTRKGAARSTKAGAAPATKQAPKAQASKPAAKPAKASDGPRTSCNFREGGWAEANGFRALTSAAFVCSKPRQKGKNHCEDHERAYVVAAKLRKAQREAADPTGAKRSAARAMVAPSAASAAKPARKPARNSGGAPRKSTPPVRPMGSGAVASTPAGKAALAAANA